MNSPGIPWVVFGRSSPSKGHFGELWWPWGQGLCLSGASCVPGKGLGAGTHGQIPFILDTAINWGLGHSSNYCFRCLPAWELPLSHSIGKVSPGRVFCSLIRGETWICTALRRGQPPLPGVCVSLPDPAAFLWGKLPPCPSHLSSGGFFYLRRHHLTLFPNIYANDPSIFVHNSWIQTQQ